MNSDFQQDYTCKTKQKKPKPKQTPQKTKPNQKKQHTKQLQQLKVKYTMTWWYLECPSVLNLAVAHSVLTYYSQTIHKRQVGCLTLNHFKGETAKLMIKIGISEVINVTFPSTYVTHSDRLGRDPHQAVCSGGQEIFIYALSKHMIYTWYKRWRENSSQVNKSEIVCPREMQYDYRIRAWETWLSCVFLKGEKKGM